MSEPDQELNFLMARLASGERAAFNRVFELLWGPVLRFCEGVLKNHADAADAAQEAMYKILERASDYDKTRPSHALGVGHCGLGVSNRDAKTRSTQRRQ